ncbi:MAG: 4-hydroxy-3-methylbut-2-enyl diphosphate reductase [Candidatus Zixiibacteriota bacterium]
MLKKIILARHHGFCMGVKRAINIADDTAHSASENEPVTILNEIVHNEAVVDRFHRKGVGRAFSVAEVGQGTLIISAHGVAPDVKASAEAKGLTVVDATCPLVTRIYDIITRVVANGYHIIHFGEKNHDETIGVVGYAPDDITVVSTEDELLALPDWKDRKLGMTVQTTAHLSTFETVEKLAATKWPQIRVFNTICDATTKRQSAVLDLAPKVDMILVVGSRTSANSKRLALISDAICGRGLLIGSAADILPEWFTNSDVSTVGISAGASTPEFLVEEVIQRLVDLSGDTAEVILPEKKRRSRAETNPA